MRAQRGEALAFIETAWNTETDECIIWPFAKHTEGYAMCGDRNRRVARVHVIICERKHGARPDKAEAAHSCGTRACINHNHLSWKTPVENAADKVRHNTVPNGERNGHAILTEDQVRRMRDLWSDGRTVKSLGEEFGVAYRTAYGIVKREKWKHV